jgi:protoporphyrinogen oxidase
MTLRSLLYELVFPGGKTEHIDGSFLYPRGGYGRITDALAGTLPPESIHTGFAVERLECGGGAVKSIRRVHFSGGRARDVEDRVVSSLPLPFLVGLLGDALPEAAREAASRLRFRHVRLLFLRLARLRVSERASIYVPDPAFCISRICEPKNRSSAMTPENETSLIVEAPCFRGDAVERLSEEEFTRKVVAELAALGLVDPKEVLETRPHFIPNAYPVCANGYARDVGVIREAFASVGNLETLGRAGRFVYSHLHDQLRFGKDCVRSLVDARRADTA